MNIGVDIVRINRFSQIIADKKKYGKILSNEEIVIFESFSSESRKMEFIAGRFAAKEAIYKALTNMKVKFTFPQVSVLPNEENALIVVFENKINFKVLVSISHSEDNAVGMALVIE